MAALCGWLGFRSCERCGGPECCWNEVRTPSFYPLFILKGIILPRQAQDKHRENSKKGLFSRSLPYGMATEVECIFELHPGKKTGFLSHLYIKVIFLPRQARDKHRENSKKARFVAEAPAESPSSSAASGAGGAAVFEKALVIISTLLTFSSFNSAHLPALCTTARLYLLQYYACVVNP
jgi:hypothetical protein